MTKTAAELTAIALVEAGLATYSGLWPVGVAREPAQGPADVITTYDTGGVDPLQLEEGLRRPTVQVRVRSEGYSEGWNKANEIFDTLGTTHGQVYGTDRVVGFSCRGDVFYVGRDANDRCLFTVNFEMTRDMSQ